MVKMRQPGWKNVLNKIQIQISLEDIYGQPPERLLLSFLNIKELYPVLYHMVGSKILM